MGVLDDKRIDFAELDVQLVEDLNKKQIDNAFQLLQSRLSTTQWIGEKHLLLSRLLALYAIEDKPDALSKIAAVIQELVKDTSAHEQSLLTKTFEPLLTKASKPLSITWRAIPDDFAKRIHTIPIYENSLEVVTSDTSSEWLPLRGKHPVLTREAVETLIKSIVMNALMAPEGTDIYDTLKNHSALLDGDILSNNEMVRNLSFKEDGSFELEIRNNFGGDALITEIEKHSGKRKVLDEREASAIIGYRTDSDGSITIEMTAAVKVGTLTHSLGDEEKMKAAMRDIQERGLEVAHVHTHPSPNFFSFVDVSLDHIGEIDGDMLTYLSLNNIQNYSFPGFEELITLDRPLAGIVLFGYQTGFMYHPQKGTVILSLT